MANGTSEPRRDSSPFTLLKSKFRLTNPDPSPLAPNADRSKPRHRHASVDSYYQRTRPPFSHHEAFTQEGHGLADVSRTDNDGDDGTVASQFRLVQNLKEEGRTTRRGRRASVPIPPRRSPVYDPLERLPEARGEPKAQQLSRLIQEISDPHGYTHTPVVPHLRTPKRKRRESVPVLSPQDDGQARAPPKLVFEALGKIPHVGGREAVDRVLDLHEWMMIHQLDLMDQEERDAVRAQEAEDDAAIEASSSSSESTSANSNPRKDYTRKTVFGVALRYISIYASTSVLLSSTAPTSVSTPSSTSSHPPIEGHTLSLPILLVSTIEELYRTGLYTASLFRLLPSPLRLRELVQVFDRYTLPKSVIVTPRPKARERGLSTRFGGSVSLHLEGVGEVGSVVSTWLGALPGGVVGVGAYLNPESSRDKEERRGGGGEGGGNGESNDGGWWRAVWEWCRVEEDDLSPHRPLLNTKEKLSFSTIYSSTQPVPYDGTHVPDSPHPASVSEIDKIRVAQLLLHLLPQPAFDALVYLLAFFSQVVLVEGTNGVGVRDVGGMFGRGVFGDGPGHGRRAERRYASGSGSGEEEERNDGGARMMCWFLRRWDRISNGLFDVPKRLVEESRVGDAIARTRMQDAPSHPDQDIEVSSTYTYPKDDRAGVQYYRRHDVDSGQGSRIEITPDVRTVPLPLSNTARRPSAPSSAPAEGARSGAERLEDPSVERGRRRRTGRDVDAEERRLRNERRPPINRDLPEPPYVEDQVPLDTRPSRRYSLEQPDKRNPIASGPTPHPRPSREGSASWQFSLSDEDVSVIGHRSDDGIDSAYQRPTGQEVSAPPMDYDEGQDAMEERPEDVSEWEFGGHEDAEPRVERGDAEVWRQRRTSLAHRVSPQAAIQVEEEEWKTRPRRDTEATDATAVGSEHEFDAPKPSVDKMLEDMMNSYKGREPPSMYESAKTISAGPRSSTVLISAHDEPLAAAVVLPLHVKPKHTAESLLAELRGEVSTETSAPGSRKASGTSMVIKTPVLELRRSESGTFSVSSTSDLEARLMDVTTDDELHAHFEAGLILHSKGAGVESQGEVKPRISSAAKPHPVQRQDTLRSLPKDRSPSRRASVYELEAELRRVKEQNKQAMGALQVASRQINSLEAKLREVDSEEAGLV